MRKTVIAKKFNPEEGLSKVLVLLTLGGIGLVASKAFALGIGGIAVILLISIYRTIYNGTI